MTEDVHWWMNGIKRDIYYWMLFDELSADNEVRPLTDQEMRSICTAMIVIDSFPPQYLVVLRKLAGTTVNRFPRGKQ